MLFRSMEIGERNQEKWCLDNDGSGETSVTVDVLLPRQCAPQFHSNCFLWNSTQNIQHALIKRT